MYAECACGVRDLRACEFRVIVARVRARASDRRRRRRRRRRREERHNIVSVCFVFVVVFVVTRRHDAFRY